MVEEQGVLEHVHLIGIGGGGLSAIALFLLQRGVFVSGSDRLDSSALEQLRQAGARVFLGHRAENIQGAGLVVRSSAVADDNVEVQAAQAAGIPVQKRVDFLGQITAGARLIAVAGTHGKTTTTAMLAWVLTRLRQDPSFIIGGVSTNLGSNAHAGAGPFFVIEADEYDHMFLGLNPEVALVTNIEHDHPDCYPAPEDFYQAFWAFTRLLRPGGVLIACGEDAGARRLASDWRQAGGKVRTYGLQSGSFDYSVQGLSPNSRGGYSGEVLLPAGHPALGLALQVPGEHNLLNALAVLAACDWLKLPLQAAAQALADFQGTGRRFEVFGEVHGILLIDDYAHHPTEIRATLAAARSRYPGRRIWAVWQPHTYSRTRTLLADFARSFSAADGVLVTEIYAAREQPPADGFSTRQVVAAIEQAGQPAVQFTPGLMEAQMYLSEHARSGDVILVLSAGDANQLTRDLFKAWQAAPVPGTSR